MTTIKENLRDFCAHQRIINTHCHHLPQPQQEASLAWVLKNAYVSWKGISYDENRDAYIRRLSGTSYYYWLAKGLSACCGIFELLNEHNSAHYDARIAEILSNPAADLKLMRDACGYDRVILDAYWNPGGDNGCPALFAPAYRINMFLFGYHQAARDHNGNNPYQCRAFEMPDSIEEYVACMEKEIEARKRSGCVALKCAAAYDRGLDFGPADLTAARTAYGKVAILVMLIDCMDYVVRFIDLPPCVRAFTAMDNDGRANIYINRRMSYATCMGSFWHEIHHLERGDFWRDADIRLVESL